MFIAGIIWPRIMPEGRAKAINLFVAKPVKTRRMHLFAELVNIYLYLF